LQLTPNSARSTTAVRSGFNLFGLGLLGGGYLAQLKADPLAAPINCIHDFLTLDPKYSNAKLIQNGSN